VKVRVVSGPQSGKEGVVVRTYRGRPATPDHVFVATEGMLPGWSTSVPVDGVEILSSMQKQEAAAE
jgi:ribosomal protein L24